MAIRTVLGSDLIVNQNPLPPFCRGKIEIGGGRFFPPALFYGNLKVAATGFGLNKYPY
jgi:hypothetical protein